MQNNQVNADKSKTEGASLTESREHKDESFICQSPYLEDDAPETEQIASAIR